MAAWKYIKGSEKDFLGAPEWALYRDKTDDREYWSEGYEKGKRYVPISDQSFVNEYAGLGYQYKVIAQRERVTSINDDRLAQDVMRHTITLVDSNPVDLSTRYEHVNGAMFQATHGQWVKTDISTYQEIKPLIVDVVNHPKHYTQGGIECIDAIKAATVGKSGIESVCVANVVKYLWRYEEKNGVEDVSKAKWYLERLIQEMGK